MSRTCVIEKNLNIYPEDDIILKEDDKRWPNGLNQVSLTNGPRRHSMSPARHSFDGRSIN